MLTRQKSKQFDVKRSYRLDIPLFLLLLFVITFSPSHKALAQKDSIKKGDINLPVIQEKEPAISSEKKDNLPEDATLKDKTPDEQLAVQYFQNKEFDKAAIYYEKLFNKNPIDFYYNSLLNCFFELKDFKKAEKLVKKQIKKQPQRYSLLVDLGYVYKCAGEISDSKKEYEKLIDNLEPNQGNIFELANAFNQRKELDYALETYLKGRKMFKDTYPFNFEVAEIYIQKGDLEAMINEYLDVLLISDGYIGQVQNSLARIYQSDQRENKNELLKNQLLRRIQKYPDRKVYAEMLIWIMIQEKDFNGAFIQAKALDRRLKEDGTRLIELAEMCSSNNQYDVAVKCYQYVIEKGNENYYYVVSKIELVNTLNKKITQFGKYTPLDLADLEKHYIQTIGELGKNAGSAPLLKGLAHLNAFYLNNDQKAIDLLEELLELPGLSDKFQAECKLDLGDILVLTDNIWDASLYFSQVEKSFKHDPIGDEAKYRNARVSYYVGDFKWAQAQLDVLKGSTSKLIANDAMQLSLFISDNTTVDTNTAPMTYFAQAELLAYQNKDEEALITLDTINNYFPAHSLADDIIYRKAKIMEKKQKFEEAAKLYQSLTELFSSDLLADDALFRLAEMQQFYFNNNEKAKEYYQKLLTNYPGSLLTVEARKRFRALRGDILN